MWVTERQASKEAQQRSGRTTEIALQFDDTCLQYARSGTSEVVRNSAVERGHTDDKNELKDGYEW